MKTKTNKSDSSNKSDLATLKAKLLEIRLAIKAHQEKNTNAHKATKKQIAQMLTNKNK
jgi:ribosomal protein L29